jgi:hypothetical protein
MKCDRKALDEANKGVNYATDPYVFAEDMGMFKPCKYGIHYHTPDINGKYNSRGLFKTPQAAREVINKIARK